MTEEYFVTYNDENSNEANLALAEYSKGLASAQVVSRQNRVRTIGSTIFQNVGPGSLSVRDGFNRRDYDTFRYDEWIPTSPKDIMQACMDAYRYIGIVKNTIDLMTDLCVQGLDIVHPVKAQERFYKKWFHDIVEAPGRSERIASLTYRAGTAVIKRHVAEIDVDTTNQMKQVSGATKPFQEVQPKKGEIPWRYTIFNPISIDILDKEYTDFINVKDREYVLLLNSGSIQTFMDRRNEGFFRNVPRDLVSSLNRALRNKKNYIPLNQDEISIVSYKKDDFELWAMPICHAILDDLKMLQKLKLADLCALDGAIAQIRLWKIGDLEHKIFPKKEAFSRLAQIIMQAVSGGVMDIMWGPAIDLKETGVELHKFLGESKYIPTLKAIFHGLGLPSALTGYGDQGFTNNMVEIKILMQRLKYMRKLLTDFWNKEIRIVQKAMGFAKPAQIVFDTSILDNEIGMLTILLQAVERNIISEELFQERVNSIPEIEKLRVKREWKEKQAGRMPPKAGQFNDPTSDDKFGKELLKTMVDNKRIDPANILEEFLDLDLEGVEIKSEEDAAALVQKTMPKKETGFNPTSDLNKGRPPGAKDKTKRKTKVATPVGQARILGFVKNLIWAENVQKEISEVVTPTYLKIKSKENVRQLTTEEFNELESFKFNVLCNIKPNTKFDNNSFKELINNDLFPPAEAKLLLDQCVLNYRTEHGSDPNVEKLRTIQSKVVALLSPILDEYQE